MSEEQDRAAWLEARKQHVTSTDAGVILGVNPWKSALQLWSEKLGLVEDDAENQAMRLGRRLQGAVLESYSEERPRAGRSDIPWPAYQLTKHPKLPFAASSFDAFEVETGAKDADGRRKVIEIKTAGSFDEEGPLPEHYVAQVQHEMAVADLGEATLVILAGGRGGQRLLWKDIQRNDEFLKRLFDAEADFYEHLKSGEPPAADASESASNALKKLYPTDSGETIVLDHEAMLAWHALDGMAKQIEGLEQRRRGLRSLIAGQMKQATYGQLPDGTLLSLKTQSSAAYTVDAKSYRVLREVKRKG